ncbi:MAG: beta-N-acetylhexosaminidase [Alphaproteobacteria bacterium]|nr:beta-N-acetylhexosaminidase [Alphaproteobacteria bacterium]
MKQASVIFGCAGERLNEAEKAFFRELNPWGLILFSRNIISKDQVRALTDDFRAAVQRDNVAVLVDQEGGRVSRLPQPVWRLPPAPTVFPHLYARCPEAAIEAAFLNYRLIAADLKPIGINIDCAPMLDVPVAGAHDIVVERALGTDVDTVCILGRAVIDGLVAGGVAPVIKHGPGHGRAVVDSHLSLPRVTAPWSELAATDFAPFRAFNREAMLMTAHVIYQDIDPLAPATISPIIIQDVVRQQCGFDGLIMTDDLNMNALSGSLEGRGRAALQAGCDMLLHCNGVMADMEQVARCAVPLTGAALRRAEGADRVAFQPAQDFDPAAARARLHALLSPPERSA